MASASPGQPCAKWADKPEGAHDGTEAFAHAGTNVIFDDGGKQNEMAKNIRLR
jgi:hypothetical protein